MKKLSCFLFLFPLFISSQNISKKVTALFIGNSYTYVNNLPQLVEQLALANGDTLIHDSYAPGGYTFNNHFNDLNTYNKIYSKDWDFVILQAQSQEPAFSPAQVNAQTLPYAMKLDSLIKNNYACGKTVFYETWGRKFGDASNCGAYPPVCTYTGMQNRLKQSYQLFASNTMGILAPAGEAFRSSITQNPNLELYQADQSHPSQEGSYLVAAVFYETLFQKSVLSNTYISSVNSSTATFLQQIAHGVMRDSISAWNLGVNLSWADYSYTNTSPALFQFQSLSAGLSNAWYFGDGNVSVSVHPSHNYSVSGTYSVSHVVTDGCYSDSVVKTIQVNLPLGLNEQSGTETSFICPNPSPDWIWFVGIGSEETTVKSIEIFDVSGRRIKQVPYTNPLSIIDLKDGLYLVELKDGRSIRPYYFVKGSQ